MQQLTALENFKNQKRIRNHSRFPWNKKRTRAQTAVEGESCGAMKIAGERADAHRENVLGTLISRSTSTLSCSVVRCASAGSQDSQLARGAHICFRWKARTRKIFFSLPFRFAEINVFYICTMDTALSTICLIALRCTGRCACLHPPRAQSRSSPLRGVAATGTWNINNKRRSTRKRDEIRQSRRYCCCLQIKHSNAV